MIEPEKKDLSYIITSNQEVIDLFRGKCVRCRKPTKTVHEIVPRSLAPKTWMKLENRILLCPDCHEWAHSRGTNNSAEELIRLREQRLSEYASTQQEFPG